MINTLREQRKLFSALTWAGIEAIIYYGHACDYGNLPRTDLNTSHIVDSRSILTVKYISPLGNSNCWKELVSFGGGRLK